MDIGSSIETFDKTYIRLKLTMFSIYCSFFDKYILAPTIYPLYNTREGREGREGGL